MKGLYWRVFGFLHINEGDSVLVALPRPRGGIEGSIVTRMLEVEAEGLTGLVCPDTL